MSFPLTLLDGPGPIVLVAPHGGRRDPERRPWEGGGLRMNDLHTAALTAEVAARTGAAAVVNALHDRNDVDLNRIGDAHAAAPHFLEAIATRVEAAVARHGRATVLTVHGWNVVQPAVDVGLGVVPGVDPFAVGPEAAVAPAFAATTLRALVGAWRAREIAATLGARYPARHRENLVQLFTRRHRADERPLVRRLARLAPQVDALQLELAIPLRWPGTWRERFVAGLVAALTAARAAEPEPGAAAPAAAPTFCRLEFVARELHGLVALDGGARLLLFPPGGGLALFTGERTGGEAAGCVGPLAVEPTDGGGVTVRFRGPLLRFPDTTPFLDLEAGLARATVEEGEVALAFVPAHAHRSPGDFGTLTGSVALAGERFRVAGDGFLEDGAVRGPWPRLRAALRLDPRTHLALTLSLADGAASGFVCRDGGHVAVVGAEAALAPAGAPRARLGLEVALADGSRLSFEAAAAVALPVVRARGPQVVRLEFVACRLAADAPPAGWCEIGGL